MLNRKAILVVGGGGDRPPKNGPLLPKEATGAQGELKQVLGKMMDESKDKGYDLRMVQIKHETDASEVIEEVRGVLASQHWDGFIIGNGTRGTPDFTILFEQLVKVGREVAPQTPNGFNTTPWDVLETIERFGLWKKTSRLALDGRPEL